MSVDDNTVRLNKYLALHTGVSRREADLLIEKGAVSINDTLATLGGRVQPGDTVTVRGRIISPETKFIYIALHKPVGYVCSRRAQGDTPTVYELLPDEYQHLKTVGRLDKDSSGLILFTNDGDFAQQMTHPTHKKVKEYEVSLDKPLEPLHQQMISDYGIQLPDGVSKIMLERLTESRKQWRVPMHEGRNRQIRRTFSALGYTVVPYHRTLFGRYALASLKKGQIRTVKGPVA